MTHALDRGPTPATLADLVPQSAIDLDLSTASNKRQTITRLLGCLDRSGVVLDCPQALEDLLEREQRGSTALGRGVALPHAKTLGAQQPVLAFGRCGGGLDFDSLDGKPVQLVFLLLVPRTRAGLHLKVMSTLTRHLREESHRRALLEAKEGGAVRRLLGEVVIQR